MICGKVFQLNFFNFCTNTEWSWWPKFRKAQLLLLSRRYWNPYFSNFSKALRRYKTACGNVMLFFKKTDCSLSNYRIKRDIRGFSFYGKVWVENHLLHGRSFISTPFWRRTSQCDCAFCWQFVINSINWTNPLVFCAQHAGFQKLAKWISQVIYLEHCLWF